MSTLRNSVPKNEQLTNCSVFLVYKQVWTCTSFNSNVNIDEQ